MAEVADPLDEQEEQFGKAIRGTMESLIPLETRIRMRLKAKQCARAIEFTRRCLSDQKDPGEIREDDLEVVELQADLAKMAAHDRRLWAKRDLLEEIALLSSVWEKPIEVPDGLPLLFGEPVFEQGEEKLQERPDATARMNLLDQQLRDLEEEIDHYYTETLPAIQHRFTALEQRR